MKLIALNGGPSERNFLMNRTGTFILAMALLAVPGLTGLRSGAAPPDLDIWKAAASGNIEAVKQHPAVAGCLERLIRQPMDECIQGTGG